MPDWPVRLILAGVAPLASFLARKQLYNRRTVVPFDTLDADGTTDLVKSILETIVQEHARMEIRIKLDDTVEEVDEETTKTRQREKGTFLKRLMHACDAEFGSVVQMIRAAVELAIYADRDHVTIDDFAKTYASFSGCRPSKNIFTAANWEELDPATALLRDDDRVWEAERLRSKGKNATRYGVRPQ